MPWRSSSSSLWGRETATARQSTTSQTTTADSRQNGGQIALSLLRGSAALFFVHVSPCVCALRVCTARSAFPFSLSTLEGPPARALAFSLSLSSLVAVNVACSPHPPSRRARSISHRLSHVPTVASPRGCSGTCVLPSSLRARY
jgi:hypothetical protein